MSESPTLTVPRSRLRRWRRWAVVLGLALLTALGSVFYYVTRPARLQDYAQRWLEGFSGGEAHIDRVELHLHGLKLIGVKVALPPDEQFDPGNDSLEARTLLHASSVSIGLQWGSLLSRSLEAKDIVAVDPDLTFVRRDDGMDNWQAMLRRRKAGAPSSLPVRMPVIQLRNARFVQYRLRKGVRTEAPPQTIWALATPVAHRPSEYDIQITRLTFEDKSNAYQRDVGRLRIDLDTLALSGQLPSLRFDELLVISTPEVLHWMDLLHLKGAVRPERFELGGAIRRVTLGLSGTSMSIPLDVNEQSLPPERRYLNLQNIHGQLELANYAAQIHLEGSFRGAAFKITGGATLPAMSEPLFEGLAFDLKFEATKLPLPRDDPERDPSESRWVRHWKALSNFVRDFDPIGTADFLVHIRKMAGRDHGVEILEGDLRPQEISARYIKFPYRVTRLTGLVHFLPDLTETIDLKGVHGSSPITITGWEGGYKTQAGELHIRSSNLPLDEDLKKCMMANDLALIERFSLQARMDLYVHMTRADAPPGTLNNPWKTTVEATLLDGSMKFAGFPYPLDRLTGKLAVADGSMRITDLVGHRQDANVHVSGLARWEGLPNPQIDLQIQANSVPIDGMLADALPGEMQDLYRQFIPKGVFQLNGDLKCQPESDSLSYDLNVHVSDGVLTLPTSEQLTLIDSTMNLKRDRVTVRSFSALFGESKVTADGWIEQGRQERPYLLHFASERLILDARLRDTLPIDYQALWDDFEPSGAAGVDFRIEQALAKSEGLSERAVKATSQAALSDKPPMSQPALTPPEYRLQVKPLAASATYASFALPLQQLRGTIVATNQGVELSDMHAWSGDASIAFSGRVDPIGEHKRTRLAVKARRLKLDDNLRRVLPPRLRGQWDAIKPIGELDVDFDELEYVTTGLPTGLWKLKGHVDFHDVTMQLGPTLSEMNGRISGSTVVSQQLGIDVGFSMEWLRVDGRLVRRAKASLYRASDDSILYLRDLKGEFYEGDVQGHAEIDYQPATPTFTVNLAAQGISLEKFLNAKRSQQQDPVRARGIVDGSMTLNGRFNEPGSRTGEGNVNIRDAQVFRIPLMFAILQVLNFTLDDNAFHDAKLHFNLSGPEMILDEIDLRGRALSMVGSGRVNTVSDSMNLAFLVGPALRLPRIAVLTDLLEDVARELMEVHVEGTIDAPTVRAEMVRSLRKTVEMLFRLGRKEPRQR